MVNTYVNALGTQRDINNGLTKTHQGGKAFAVDKWKQARRFLILGSEGGTFYVSEQSLTLANVKSIQACLAENGRKLVDMIVEISDRALAPKNEPALLALAAAASYTDPQRETYAADVRSYALANLPKVARMSTHLFHFVTYVDQLRGWGSGLRKAIGSWYTDGHSNEWIAQQVTKYVQRDGWSHADVLRKSHPTPKSETQNAIFKYVVDGELPSGDRILSDNALAYLAVVEEIKHADSAHAIKLIETYNLPREVLPTPLLNDVKVWEALLYAGKGMPLTAMLRNLGKMTSIGLTTQGSKASRFVLDRLADVDAIKGARVHPIDMLKAKLIYQYGRGIKGDLAWTPVTSIRNALESGFYLSFGNVPKSGKRIMLALDVSGSMSTGSIGGIYGLSPRVASGALALVTARVEDDYEIYGFSNRFIDLKISGHDSLNDVIGKISSLPFAGTDCSLPMRFARGNGRKYDAFVVYTDSETGGYREAHTELKKYRQESGIYDSKLIVNAMTSSGFSIADPSDPNMLDVVGFDSSAPQVMSEFIAGSI